MKIYIAGAITGDPEYREKFRRAEEAVRAEGHVAVNPAVLPEGLEPGDYMRICTALRCAAAEDVHETHCETCPYYVVEDLSGEEAAFFGEKWATCDVDRMALDAAAMIEELSGRDV